VALESVPGVREVKVDFPSKTATLKVDKGTKVDTETVQAALKKEGFGGSVKS